MHFSGVGPPGLVKDRNLRDRHECLARTCTVTRASSLVKRQVKNVLQNSGRGGLSAGPWPSRFDLAATVDQAMMQPPVTATGGASGEARHGGRAGAVSRYW